MLHSQRYEFTHKLNKRIFISLQSVFHEQFSSRTEQLRSKTRALAGVFFFGVGAGQGGCEIYLICGMQPISLELENSRGG